MNNVKNNNKFSEARRNVLILFLIFICMPALCSGRSAVPFKCAAQQCEGTVLSFVFKNTGDKKIVRMTVSVEFYEDSLQDDAVVRTVEVEQEIEPGKAAFVSFDGASVYDGYSEEEQDLLCSSGDMMVVKITYDDGTVWTR
jgi:hypothetical protein